MKNIFIFSTIFILFLLVLALYYYLFSPLQQCKRIVSIGQVVTSENANDRCDNLPW